MKRISYFLALAFLASSIAFVGCKKKEDEEPVTEDCASKTFPSNTGSAAVSILNYPNAASGISVAAGDVLSFAVQITKGTNRPQKLRIYQTDCANEVGTIVSIAGQPGAEDGGTRLDLRNTDAAQIRQFAYTVPTGMSTIYLNIEIDESNTTYTYSRVKLNVSGSGIIDTWTATLGAQDNALASRMSSGTGQTYTACNAAANMDYIDIAYSWNTSGYLSSNPARFELPIGLSNSNPTGCGDTEDNLTSTDGGNPTYFLAYGGTDFATITDAQLSALTVSSSDDQYVSFTSAGGVYQFLNSKGKKGLIKVNSYTTAVNGTVGIEVKVQR